MGIIGGVPKHGVFIAIDGVTVFGGYLNDEEYKNFEMAGPNLRQPLSIARISGVVPQHPPVK